MFIRPTWCNRNNFSIAERITAHKPRFDLVLAGFFFLLVVFMDGYGISKEGCDLNYPEIPEGLDGIWTL